MDDAPQVQSFAGGGCSAPAPAIGTTSATKQQKDNTTRRISRINGTGALRDTDAEVCDPERRDETSETGITTR